MRPHDKPKGKRATEAAVRTHLRAYLGWLRGFPDDETATNEITWFTLPPLDSRARPETLRITREALRRTEFGRNAARRRFPAALARVVGDVDVWVARTDAQLRFLKNTVHDGASLPDLGELLKSGGFRRATRDRATRLARDEPTLAPALTALVWLHWNDESALVAALKLMRQYTAELLRLRPRLDEPAWRVTTLQSLELLADGSDPVLLQLLADDRCWEVPTTIEDYRDRLKRALNERPAARAVDGAPAGFQIDRAKPRLGGELVSFVSSLSGTPRQSRQRRVVLLERLVTDELLDGWARWWAKADALERAVRRLGHRQRRSSELKSERRRLEKRINTELEKRRPFSWTTLEGLVDRLSDAASAKAFEALIGCLDHVGLSVRGQSIVRTFLHQWDDVLGTPARGKGVATRLLQAQRDLFTQFDAAEEPQHISTVARLTSELIDTWIESPRPQRLIKPAIEAVSKLIATAPEWDAREWPNGWDELVTAVELTGDPDLAASAVAHRPPDAFGLQGEAWATLLRLSGPELERFKLLAAAWKPEQWTQALVKELASLIKAPEAAALSIGAFESGNGQRLSRIVALSGLARSLGVEPGAETEKRTSAALDPTPYPYELHGLLEELMRCDPNADRAVDAILGKDFPRPERLQSELAAIRKKLENAVPGDRRALSARARSLETRLSTPVSISVKRLENYRVKLERRFQHARLGQWEYRLGKQVRAALHGTLGFAPPDAWLERDDITRVLASLAELEPGFRRLAIRLLKARCGPEPWDLRGAAQNRAFLDRLKRRKVNATPWLEGPEPRRVSVGSGALQLALERDPLEVMRMGEPFQTCLAPGSFNFFSAVANAADINKRVLYARDDNGKVQARCLLALTDDGHLLTFNLYAHRTNDAMQQAVADFVRNLANAMGTSVVPAGHVSNLVAPDWYDDGTTDITGRLAFLRPKSAFAEALPSMQSDEIVPALRRALAPDPITPSIVAALIDSPAVQTRPELFLPLLPYLKPETLDPWTRVRVITMLRKSGAARTARDLAAPLFRDTLSLGDTMLAVQVAEELIALGLPSLALRLIRSSRPKGVHSWSDEWTGRTLVAAKAMEHLARPKKAQELYRIAGRDGG
ncbi:MAG: hypothetical protein GY798_01070 [Hyphomicrobiales bacterium]|nr:hypothetical protein [Hyphomicrobiales bacterium]